MYFLKIKSVNSRSILTKTSGYLDGFTHSLNPYIGCAFGCSYCYVRKMPVSIFHNGEWGDWVDYKENAIELLKKELKKNMLIFMSSSTDPYQPLESKLKLTQRILETMVLNPPDYVFIQTRSPMIKRDVSIIKQLPPEHYRVGITIETDRKDILKEFTPNTPSFLSRLRTLELLQRNNIPTQATISPILPYSNNFFLHA